VNVLDETVGAPLPDAAQNFEDHWADGRYQLRKQRDQLAGTITTILERFTQTDDEVAEPLST
jgi:hypothetical protein